MCSRKDILTCNTKGKICSDCGNEIEIGEKYYSYVSSPRKLNYVYCMPCKSKPEHTMPRHDYEAIYKDLYGMPLFKHEFMVRHDFDSRRSNEIMRNLISNGYEVRIFRWRARSSNSKLGSNERYTSYHQPSNFTIYFVIGTEHEVIKRILEEFELVQIKYRDMLGSLYGCKIPRRLSSKKAIMTWADANRNVFN